MAKKNGASNDAAKPPSGKGKLIIIILVVVLILAIGGGVAAYFLLSGDGGESAEAGGEEVSESSTIEEPEPEPLGPLTYHPIESMTVNLSAEGPVRFLRVSVSVMTRNAAVGEAIDRHIPMIKNDFLVHLAAQDFATLNTPEGKDKLREELQEMLAGLLIKAGEPAQIEGILFTDLVMQ